MKNNYSIILLALGLLCSIRSYAQWTEATVTGNTGDDIQCIAFSDDNTAFATGWSGVLYKSTDGGENWSLQTTTLPSVDMYAVAFIDASTGFIMGDQGRIYKTTDGGATWAQKTSGTTESIYNIAILSNNTTIFAVGSGGLLLKSTDTGDTWTSQSSPSAEINRSIKFAGDNESVAYLIGDNAGDATSVYKSTDGGVSWTVQTVPAATDGDPVNLFGLSVVDASTAFVCGGSKRIAKTTDGSSWTNVNSNLANFYRACHFTSSTSGYVVGAAGKILSTSNGTSFTSETTGVTSILNTIAENSAGTLLVAGAEGTILRKASVTNQAPVANDDNGGTIQENGADGTVNILTNDTDTDGNPTTSSGHTVDLDFITPGVQSTVTSPIDQSVWTYNTSTGMVTCNPATDFDGVTAMIYTLCDSDGLCDNATITFTVENTTGLEEHQYITQLYPNPVNDVLSIQTQQAVKSMRIFDLNGKELLSACGTTILHVEKIHTGTYLLEVVFENGTRTRGTFIKN
ncbi:MAG: YCF48-related protein [Bacteroidota bacterium]